MSLPTHRAGPRMEFSAPAGSQFCQSCGETFTPTQKAQRFCSAKCRMRAWRKSHSKREDVSMPEVKTCKVCEAPFKPTRSWHHFCSLSCRIRACRKRAIPTFENLTEAEDYVVRLIRAMNRHAKTSRQ